MFKILIDTCVWLDLAQNHKQQIILDVLEEMIEDKEVSLIVPQTVIEEFKRNKEHIISSGSKSISSNLKSIKDLADRMDIKQKNKKALINSLNDLDHNIPTYSESIKDTINKIEKLLNKSETIKLSDAIKLRAFQKAHDKKAPFHNGKNNIADAIIIETYATYIENNNSVNTRFAFITLNKNDFSYKGNDEKKPHPDIAFYFSRKKSLYFIQLAEALRRINPKRVTESMLQSAWALESRSLSEISEVEGEFFDKVWYNRHQNWLYRIRIGEDKIVNKLPEGEYIPNVTPKDIYVAARKAAKKIEKRYGKKNLGPWDDFEWGMINGKLSALRWVTGYEWDFLDT